LISHDNGESAAALAERAVKIMPDDLPLVALHADLLIQQDRDKEAVDLLKSYVRHHPDNEKAQAELAFTLLRSGHADEAMRIFSRIPESMLTPQMRFAYAQALNSVRRFSDAEKQLRIAVKEDQQYAEAWQLLALTLEEMDRPQEAMAIYTRLLGVDPANRSARLFLLRHHLRTGDMDAAVALVADSQEPLRFAVAASAILAEEKQMQKADEIMLRFEKLPEMSADLFFYHAGIVYENGGDISRALQLLSRVPADSAEYGKALRMKVRMLCDLNRIPEALTTLEEVRTMYPEDVEPLLLKAELLTQQKKFEEAKNTLRIALASHPDHEIANFQFAYLHELHGEHKEAMRLMEAVIERFPENAMALNFVGYNLADSGRELNRAYTLIEKAVTLEPDADYIVDSMAWICFKLGRIDEAWAHIQRAIELNRSGKGADPSMLEHYGDISLARRDRENALYGYQKALDIFLKYNLKNDAARVQKKLNNL
ncbi:MAG: tetratricopeptide repeat protein, partial [Mailhella sp.]|nr:tetratricopeptide repeat protein [Mailhella sp.]